MPEGQWHRVSGRQPDLGLDPTPPGTRYLEDTDPARDPDLNPPFSGRERLRRLLGRRPRSPWHGRVGFPALTEAWNSAVFASQHGKAGSMVLLGGGHANYYGSSVHAFDLASRSWSRLTDGYVDGNEDAYGRGAVYPNGTYPDGSPVPPHTYDYLQYDPLTHRIVLFKGQTELGENVQAVAIPHVLDLATLTWRRGPEHPDAILNSAGFTTWDERRRTLWGHSGDDAGGNAFLGYCPDGDNDDGTIGRWGVRYDNKFHGYANHNCMQINAGGNLIVAVNHQRDVLYGINPEQPGGAPEVLKEAGRKLPLAPYASLEYSKSLQRFVYYSACDGTRIHNIRGPEELDWPAQSSSSWTWSAANPGRQRLDPIADAAETSMHAVSRSHTFGRFRVAEYPDGVVLAILVRHVDTPVYALKLAG